MRELELRDISGYLPYGLKCHEAGVPDDKEPLEYRLLGLTIESGYIWIDIISEEYDEKSLGITSIIPILHPMSDLAKPITVKGYNDDKEFLPIEKISEIMDLDGYNGLYTSVEVQDKTLNFSIWGGKVATYDYHLNLLSFKPGNSCHLSFNMSRKILGLLNQWHFDYNGLIDEGLAIDINTLRSDEKK